MVASTSNSSIIRQPSSTQHAPSNSSQEEEINIYLKIMRTVGFKVKKSETIKDLKGQLCEKYGFTENHQELFLAGDLLMDCQRLVDCGVQRDSTVHVVLQNNDGIKLFVKLPSGLRTIDIEAKAHDTIRSIKAMIQTKEMIPSKGLTLVYCGELLEEDSSLASLGINNESTLQIVFTPKDQLSISVDIPSGRTLKLKVRALFTVTDVKNIVGNMIDVSISDYNLIYSGKQLEDIKTLAFYDIKDESVLQIAPHCFQIFVKHSGGKFTIEVKRSDTVEAVKVKVLHKLKVFAKPYNCPMIYAGNVLQDWTTLAFYNIEQNSTLEVLPSPFQIFVKSWSGKTISLDVTSLSTVSQVKNHISGKVGVPVKVFRIMYAGKRLEDESRLASYNIQKDSTLQMVLSCGTTCVNRS